MYRYTSRTFARELLLLACAALWWIPFYLLIATSLKTNREALGSPFDLPSSPQLGNYGTAWAGHGGVSLGSAFFNSALITGVSVIALIALGSTCAYAIARRSGSMSTLLYSLFVIGIILPFQLGVIPVYAVFVNLGLVGTQVGMILLYIGLLMPLTVFLYTGFIRVLPPEYEEAARVDGAGHVMTFLRVVFPLLGPVTGTVATLTGIIIWNDFFLQLVFLGGSQQFTLPVAIFSFVGEYVAQWNLIFATVAVSIIPVLAFYVVAQRQLVRGFTGGIKG